MKTLTKTLLATTLVSASFLASTNLHANPSPGVAATQPRSDGMMPGGMRHMMKSCNEMMDSQGHRENAAGQPGNSTD